jgi:hypothetical protein
LPGRQHRAAERAKGAGRLMRAFLIAAGIALAERGQDFIADGAGRIGQIIDP